ncbi:MAG: TolC family protein [Acidobacteria bacterium]|nr:TolC family protein [Acidobacteriota bacterium]MBU4330172.1 TolC family protein [Acidobacteriota bacterium]MBU4495230.1 TolC family protein [Acidobacteriota bacterium]MCG2814720.1 TolC family protein [Candidatus Aminicenantes bacterium]
MIKRIVRSTLVLGLLFGLTFTPAAQEDPKKMNLTLEDCILKALENNLNIAINVLSPELSDIAVARANEKFMPQLSMNLSTRDTSSASYSFLDAAGAVATVTDNYSADILQAIPTGGQFSFQVDGYKTDTNRSFQTINPRYGTTLTFNFSQPLLRDFGFKMAKREILVAKNDQAVSRKDFETNLSNTILNVEEAYWNYVYSIELLKVRKQSLKLAEDLLEKNKRSVEIGTLAPIEILSAEAEVATRHADILQTQAQVRNAEDQLKALMNLQADGAEAEAMNLIPVDKPSYEKKTIDFEEALAIAIENRPDLESTRISLKNSELNLSYAKNQLLPSLNLTASYWSPGVSGDQIIYLNNNALSGVIIGVVPGGSTDAFKDTFGFKYSNWSVGVTLDFPLSNILSKANYATARVSLEQARLRMQNEEQQAFVEVKSAVRSVQTDYERVLAYTVARELAQRKMEAEEEKLKVGLSTNYLVLLNQREFRNAQVQELQSIVAYNLSLAQLQQAMGLTLTDRSIKIGSLIGD